MGVRFSLSKTERLKSRKIIEELFDEGKKFSIETIRIFYLVIESEQHGVLFGTGTSVKLFRKSVDRNRIKRLIRESYRLQKSMLKEEMIRQKKQLAVFFLYTGKKLPVYQDIYLNTGKCLEKLRKQL